MSSAVEGWQRTALLGVRQWRLSAIALGFAREERNGSSVKECECARYQCYWKAGGPDVMHRATNERRVGGKEH